MAGETYYYLFSTIVVAGSLFWTVHMIYFKRKHRTLLGRSYKVGTPERKKLDQYSSPLGITIAAIITLTFLANLVYSAARVARLGTADARFMLVFGPVFVVFIFVCGIFIAIKKLKDI